MADAHLVPWFPAWGVSMPGPIGEPADVVALFNEWRPSERWLLLAYEAACSEIRLWTAWSALRRREQAGRMVARTCDAEFLRLISGTHQLSTAFERAGINSGDEFAWIVYLPEFGEGEGFGEIEIPRSTYLNNDLGATRLIEHLGGTLLARRPVPSEEGLLRLGAIEPGDSIQVTKQEDAYLLHTALADM
ncbi:MAG: hypothetical protein DSY41_01840 [Candidatus Poseidoniales archaeon]|nr:MAG: hypothetical protein DSY41_01840 [Candidatus Poseidoniales archaeon]